MKIKLLVDRGSSKAGEIFEAIKSPEVNWCVFYPKDDTCTECAYTGQYEIVKDEPIEEKQSSFYTEGKYASYESLIAELSEYVSEIKFK